jgi:hypothetical protein
MAQVSQHNAAKLDTNLPKVSTHSIEKSPCPGGWSESGSDAIGGELESGCDAAGCPCENSDAR